MPGDPTVNPVESEFDRVGRHDPHGHVALRHQTAPDTASFGKRAPLGRPAQPVETAPACAFPASPQARCITAEIVNATGGAPFDPESLRV